MTPSPAPRSRVRRRIVLIPAALVLVAALVLGFALSWDQSCPQPVAAADALGGSVHLAWTAPCYGGEDALRLEPVASRELGSDEIRVRLHAAGVNPLDWHRVAGEPYIMRLSEGLGRPEAPRIGVDFAGVVEEVGADVTRFRVGDRVFGGATGAFAESLVVREDRVLAMIPEGVDFEVAAAVPVAGTTALQALRMAGEVGPGVRVLVNGASGGVGTFTVQIAKAMGAEVTGVSSARNLELVRSFGADHVIDYAETDFTRGEARWDVVIDNVGNHALRDLRRALEPGGHLVMVTGPKSNRWLGPVTRLAWSRITDPFTAVEQRSLLASLNRDDLELLAGMLGQGSLTAPIDQRFPLTELPSAISYQGAGRTRGKNIVQIRLPEAPGPVTPE